MNIYLGDHFETMIREQVATGRYANASEVVREALRILETRESKLTWLRSELEVAADQARRGELVEFTDELMDRLSREAEENLRNGKPIKDAIRP